MFIILHNSKRGTLKGAYYLSEEKCGRNIVQLKFLKYFSSHSFNVTPLRYYVEI
jgi:hypothetical protein